MILPSQLSVGSSTPIYKGSNFTWGEATKNCTRYVGDLFVDNKLILSSNAIEQNIIATAQQLDKVRLILGGHPVWVNSWYRPKHINQRVGGAKYSRHQYGDAVDIRSDYLSPQAIYRLLDKVHDGGLGRYYNFIHLDWRGYKARWFG